MNRLAWCMVLGLACCPLVGWAADPVTMTVRLRDGLVLVQGELEALSAFKEDLQGHADGTLSEETLARLLKGHGLLAQAEFFSVVRRDGPEKTQARGRAMTLAKAEAEGLLPVLRNGLDSMAYFQRLRDLGFTPLWGEVPPDPLSQRLPVDVCLQSATWTTGDLASLRVGGRELYRDDIPFGMSLATLPPGARDWTFETFNTFVPGRGGELAGRLKGLAEGTVVLMAVRGAANRNLGGAALQGLQALGSRLSIHQIGSDQHLFGHVLIAVVGRPSLSLEKIDDDQMVRLCHHGRQSYFSTAEMNLKTPLLPAVVFNGFDDESSVWLIDSQDRSLPSFSPAP